MRVLFILISLLIISLKSFSQSDGLSYQAVILDKDPFQLPGPDIEGTYLSNGQVSFRFTIYQETGEIIYQEVQETVTDEFGMVNLVIGLAEETLESNIPFNQIDWDGRPKDLGVEIRYESGSFEDLSRQALLFLPYAFHRNITATGNLLVDGTTDLGGDLTVSNQSNTNLTGNLAVGGTSDLGGALAVSNQSTTTLTGNLFVEGPTDLGGDFLVSNEANTTLTGNLDVFGNATFFGSSSFEDLVVENTTTLNGPTAVENQSPVDLSGQLTVDGSTDLNGDLSVGGISEFTDQVTVNANVAGSQQNYGAYPFRVQGSNQGIAIRVNGGETETKNFVTFFNGSTSPVGRIEGQTLSELQSSFRFIWDVATGGLEQAFITAEGIACGTQLDFAESAVMVANSALYGAQWVELTANYELNVGVAFLSGGADYAEWLELADKNDKIFPGEVVGIKNGKVSRNTQGADHILAVSTNPIVLGNMPPEGKKSDFAKIAFLGQVPIRVVGRVEAGDYILPSGYNDGMAIAFSSDELPSDKYDEIIGVAWEGSNSHSPTLVNVAIGLNKNNLSEKVSALEKEIELLRKEIEGIKSVLFEGQSTSEQGIDNHLNQEKSSSEPLAKDLIMSNEFVLSKEKFEEWISEFGYVFENQMTAIRSEFEKRDIDYQQFEEAALLIDTPLAALRKMHSGEFLPSVWANFERRMKRIK